MDDIEMAERGGRSDSVRQSPDFTHPLVPEPSTILPPDVTHSLTPSRLTPESTHPLFRQTPTITRSNLSIYPPSESTDLPDPPTSPSYHQVQRTAKTNVLLAWVTCLFCCWPIGLVAVVHAARSRRANRRRDLVKGRYHGVAAKHFAVGAVVAGVSLYVVAGFVLVLLLMDME